MQTEVESTLKVKHLRARLDWGVWYTIHTGLACYVPLDACILFLLPGGCDTHFPLPQWWEGELKTGVPAGELQGRTQGHQVTGVSLLGNVKWLLKLVARPRELMMNPMMREALVNTEPFFIVWFLLITASSEGFIVLKNLETKVSPARDGQPLTKLLTHLIGIWSQQLKAHVSLFFLWPSNKIYIWKPYDDNWFRKPKSVWGALKRRSGLQ